MPEWDDDNNEPKLVGDYNGDGLDDLVGFRSDGIFVAFSRGRRPFMEK